MADARVVEIVVPVEVGTTHFNLRYSTDGDVWTGLYVSGSGPATDDLAVGLLVSGTYTLDGINSPTGNEAVASAEGVWYTLRLKSAAGYGSWSVPFKVAYEPDDDGPLADVASLLAMLGLTPYTLRMGTPGAERQDQLEQLAAECLTAAMDEMRLTTVLDDLYTGSRTAGETRLIQRAERYWAAAELYERAVALRAVGRNAALADQEDTETLLAVIAHWRGKYAALFASLSTDSSAGLPELETGTLSLPTADQSPWSLYRTDLEALV